MSKMQNIDQIIPYNWPFGWSVEGMANPQPIVNRFLKVIIEGEIPLMESLYQQGATLESIDKETFHRVLYHIINKYDVMSWLIRHGMSFQNTDYCIDPDGYRWGLIARAWYIGAYDVMELLAYYGFNELYFCVNGNGWDAAELMFKNGDVQAMKILKEHGYIEAVDYAYGIPYSIYRRKYPNSKVTLYLEENPVIRRKSVGMDYLKFRRIPEPKLEKEGILHRKDSRRRNEIVMADYNDRISTQQEYLKKFSYKLCD